MFSLPPNPRTTSLFTLHQLIPLILQLTKSFFDLHHPHPHQALPSKLGLCYALSHTLPHSFPSFLYHDVQLRSSGWIYLQSVFTASRACSHIANTEPELSGCSANSCGTREDNLCPGSGYVTASEPSLNLLGFQVCHVPPSSQNSELT